MLRIELLAATALAVCTSAAFGAQPLLDINPVVAVPTCERTDLVVGEGPAAFPVVRRWAGDGWLTTFDAGVHLSDEAAWLVTLDAEAYELVQQGEDWVTRAGKSLVVSRANQGYRLLDHTTGDVLWFDELGTPVARESAAGRVEFEVAGFGVSAVQGVWGRIAVERDAAGRVTAIDAPGAHVSYRFEGEALTSVTGPRGDEVYSYSEGRLSQAGATRVTYDAEGRATALEGGRAPLRITYSDADGWDLVADVQRSGEREQVRFSADRRLLVIAGSRGTTRTRFDGRLRPTSVEHNGTLVLRRSYDAQQRLSSLETPEGRANWSYTGDDRNPSRVTLPGGSEVRYVRNEAGQVTLRQGPRGAERFAYNPWGALTKHRSARGVVTRYTRDAQGYTTAVDHNGQVTRIERASDGEVRTITTPDGRKTEFRAKGRRVLVQDERGLVYAAAYDEAGRPVAWRDASGRTLRYTYNDMGLLTRAFDGEGDLLACSYYDDGQLRTVTDATGNTVRYEHPEAGTVVVHDPSSGTRTLSFDEAGQLIREQRGDVALSYRYDDDGRLVGRTTPEGVERISYDRQGRVVSHSSPDTTLRYSYTPNGQLAELSNSALRASIRFGYDASGLRSKVELPWGTQEYERDDQGRVTAVIADGERVEFDLLPDGRRAAIRYPNGVETALGYDRERLATLETTHDGELLERRTYAYDAGGRVTSCSDTQGKTVRYSYDARGQLIAAAGETRLDYAYDAQGNRVAEASQGSQRDYELGTGNRVVALGEQTFHYDSRGALAKRTGPEGETRYRYDTDGRLREVQGPGDARVRYGYAPDGSRLWRQGAAGRVFELSDGTNVLGERAGGEWVTRYVHGDTVDDLLLAQRAEGSYAYHTDLVSSVTAISGPQGDVAARYAYGPYGESQVAEGRAAAWNTYRYTSRSFDAQTGLYDYRARSYDPNLGRFTSTDPSGRLGGVNLYAYASNDPVRFNDPYGLEPMPGRGAPTAEQSQNAFEQALDSMDASAATLNPVDRAAYELVRGAGDFVGDTVMGVVDLFKKQTWVDLGEAIATIKEDPALLKEIGRQLGNGAIGKFDEYIDAWKNNPWKALRMTGYGIASAATVAVGALKAIQTINAVAKAAKAAKAAKRAAQLAKAAKRGRQAAAAGVLANAGRGSQVANGAGNLARRARQASKGVNKALDDMDGGGASKGGAGAASKGCFLAGTLVETLRGRVPVEQIQVGDQVFSRSDRSGEQGFRPVARLFRGTTDRVVTLAVSRYRPRGRTQPHRVGTAQAGGEDADPAGPQSIRCTTEHPFFVVGSGWVTAEFLLPGDQLVSARNEALVVSDHQIEGEVAAHFNFEVEEWHTYFVSGTEDAPSIWVHNACFYDKPKAKARNAQVGDRVRSPSSHASDFSRNRQGQYINKKTGEIWERSHTNHSNSPGGEWKVGSRRGQGPTKGNKITLSDDGTIVKFDN